MRGHLARLLLCALPLMCLPVSALATDASQRIVSLGGNVTEIIYELDQGHNLVGTDLSSIYPPQARTLPQVGYYRSLPLEGLISLQPELILASEQAGPPDVLKRVQELGIPLETVRDNGTLDALYERIRHIATALNTAEQGNALANRVRTEIEQAVSEAQTQAPSDKPVTAVMLLKRTTQIQAAGAGTTAGTLLELAGLHNLMAGHHGYNVVSADALANLQPELIVTTTSSIKALGGQDAFLVSAGIALTPAAARRQLLVLDDMLILGLGPRTAQAIQALATARDSAAGTRPDQ